MCYIYDNKKVIHLVSTTCVVKVQLMLYGVKLGKHL